MTAQEKIAWRKLSKPAQTQEQIKLARIKKLKAEIRKVRSWTDPDNML